MRKIIFFILAAALCLFSCSKPVENCRYVIKPYMQAENKGALAIAPDVIAYVFFADTTAWAVTSYENAAAGVLSSLTGSGTRNFDLKAEADDTGLLEFPSITRQPVFVLVCDTQNQLYGWQQADIPGGLTSLIVSITFCPWKEQSLYWDGRWRMQNDNPPSPQKPEEPEEPEVPEE